jgi:hypothetical protein
MSQLHAAQHRPPLLPPPQCALQQLPLPSVRPGCACASWQWALVLRQWQPPPHARPPQLLLLALLLRL